MNKRVERYISWLNRRRTDRRRFMSLVLALSVFVSGNVFWFMRGVGTALENEPSCGITEHTHTEDCYGKELVCDQEHEHTDECYETVLTCGLEEHVHTDSCYITKSIERENAQDWEKTLPELSGTYSRDLINCAVSQIGYEEHEDGYTRFGDWYGNAVADWNMIFVSFSMHYAGISQEQIPLGSGCWAWQTKIEEAGLLSDMTEMPEPGDILLLDRDGDGKCDRVGIIVDVTDGIISTVEGDVDGRTDTRTYDEDDNALFGYVSVNSLDVENGGDENEIIPGDGEETESAEQAEAEITQAVVEFSAATESGIEVKVTAPENAFPEGVTMSAEDVIDEDIIACAEDAVEEDREIKGSIAVDITFTDSEGNEIEPAEGVSVGVSIAFPEDVQVEANDYRLFHIIGSDATEVEDAQISQTEVQFTSESFSIYVITATGRRSKDKVHAWISNAGMGNLYDHREYDPSTGTFSDYIVNDEEYPYELRVGDTVTLTGHDDNNTPRFVIDNSYGFVNIEIVSQSDPADNEVTCVIRATGPAYWNAKTRVMLEGTGEYFYIYVRDFSANDFYLDMENAPEYNLGAPSITDYYVPFGQKVTLAGYPYNDAWGRIFMDDFSTPNENPYGWSRVSTNPEEHIRYDGKSEMTFTIDRFYDGSVEERSVILTQHLSDGTWRKIRIIPTINGVIDHADIEIADGGIYTNVQIEGGDNGELYKTVTEYQSFVYDVNYSEMHDINGAVVPFYDNSSNYQQFAVSRFIGGRDPVTGDYNDYWSNPEYIPGNSQYELTSKYTVPPGEDFETGHVRWGQKRFFYGDVDSAVFDVELQIIPRHIQKYIWDADANGGTGDWVPVAGNDIEYDIQYDLGAGKYRVRTDGGAWSELTDLKPADQGGIVNYKNEVFDLDRRAVIDAYNKCPNHSGLDFTVHHDLSTIEITASKELLGRPLQNEEFQFKIFDNLADVTSTTTPAPAGVASAKNDANGKIVFENLEFENVTGEHTYTYYMKEIKGNDSTVIYDPVVYKIVIDVNKVYPGAGNNGQDLIVPVDISSFTRLKTGGDPSVDSDYLPADKFMFQNIVDTFKLPDTGGGGIVPYLAAGTILIGGAAILLILSRRKEVEQ